MKHLIRVAALFLIALAFASMVQADQNFTIVQDTPTIIHVDVGAEGHTHGDIMAFTASFVTEDGKTGIMRGIIMTVDIPLPSSGKVLHDRLAQIVVEFGEADTLVIGGSATYPTGDGEMFTDSPQLRAVICGTGRFIGARGQVATVRLNTGLYEHRFTLLE